MEELKDKRISTENLRKEKENLKEVNIEKAQKEFKNFVKLHKEEIERIKKRKCKNIKVYGILK